MDEQEKVLAFIPFFVLIGTFVLAAYWLSRRAKTRELLHRERLAMIEKGLMPPPEAWTPMAAGLAAPLANPAPAAPRYRSIGVVITALGLGLMLLIGVAFEAGRIGVGVGGAVVVLGLALIVNSYLATGHGRPAAGRLPAQPEDRIAD